MTKNRHFQHSTKRGKKQFCNINIFTQQKTINPLKEIPQFNTQNALQKQELYFAPNLELHFQKVCLRLPDVTTSNKLPIYYQDITENFSDDNLSI